MNQSEADMDNEMAGVLDELAKAAERLGRNPDECMRWVLKFAQADLPKYSEGQWADLATEVAIFIGRGPLVSVGRNITHLGAAFDWSGPPPKSARLKEEWVTYAPHPSRQQVLALQKHTKEALDIFAQRKELKFVLGPLHMTLEPWRVSRGGLSLKSHTPVDAFKFHLALLFSHYYGRVRSCGECSTLFLADRRNQLYCATRCLTRVTQRRWRERHMKKKPSKTTKRSLRQAGAKGARHGTKRR